VARFLHTKTPQRTLYEVELKPNVKNRVIQARNFAWMLLRDLPFQAIEPDVRAREDSLLAIPNNVYQTWETLELGRRHKKSREAFIALNPEFNFHVFDRKRRDR
jgi:mannosyltransferase OCH1-like enzyme